MKTKPLIRDILVLLVMLVLAWFISTYLFQFALIEGSSMEPSYHSGQLVVLNRCSKELQKGDVAAFFCPELNSTLIKRVTACAGDTVLIDGGRLYINGREEENFGVIEYAGIAARELIVPDGCFFMLGENTAESKDSRYEAVGLVSAEYVTGRLISLH